MVVGRVNRMVVGWVILMVVGTVNRMVVGWVGWVILMVLGTVTCVVGVGTKVKAVVSERLGVWNGVVVPLPPP